MGPYVSEMNGKAYMSSTVRLIRAKIISVQKRNSHAVMILLAVLNGLLVAIRRPAKNDCEMPI